MTGTGSVGTPSSPLAKLFTERVVFDVRTSDPASPQKGAVWFRDDLDSGTDKFGELRWYDGSATNSIPVFDKGTSSSNVEEVIGVKTADGIGYVPTASRTRAAFPQLSFQHGGSTLGVHDSTSVAPIIDDFEDGDTTPLDSNWGAWSNVTNVSTTNLQGDRAGEASASSSFVDHESSRGSAIAASKFEILVRPTTTNGASGDGFEFNLLQGSTRGMQSRFDGAGNIEIPFGTDVATYSVDTTYKLRYYNIDYSANTFDAEVIRQSDGQTIASKTGVSFTNDISAIDLIQIRVDVNNGGGANTTQFDYVIVGGD